MKTFKKIVAVIMIIVTLFCSFAFVVSAEDANATDENEYVATVYVCQRQGFIICRVTHGFIL
mgnify:CR=1 FL=1